MPSRPGDSAPVEIHALTVDVASGPDGILAGLTTGKTWVDKLSEAPTVYAFAGLGISVDVVP